MIRETIFETDFQFDCPFCDTVLQSEMVGELKDNGSQHLKHHDYQEVSTAFAETYGGNECHNDCGYVYPTDTEDIEEYTCPNCGFDHRHVFAQRYLYWHIKTT